MGNNSKFEGIITYEDLIRTVLLHKPQKEILVYISGLEKVKDEEIEEYMAQKFVRTAIQKLAALVNNIIGVRIDLNAVKKQGFINDIILV